MERRNYYTIGVDLDSTLIETNAAEMAARELGYAIGNKDVTKWNHLNFPEDLREKIMEYFMDPVHMCDQAKPIEGSQATITEWTKSGHNIVLITARAETLKESTVEMVKRLFPEINEIHVVGVDKSKISVMLEKEIDFWVDDAPHGVLDAIKVGIPTYMISNNYTKYNWPVRDHGSLKGVVKTISEIAEFSNRVGIYNA